MPGAVGLLTRKPVSGPHLIPWGYLESSCVQFGQQTHTAACKSTVTSKKALADSTEPVTYTRALKGREGCPEAAVPSWPMSEGSGVITDSPQGVHHRAAGSPPPSTPFFQLLLDSVHVSYSGRVGFYCFKARIQAGSHHCNPRHIPRWHTPFTTTVLLLTS